LSLDIDEKLKEIMAVQKDTLGLVKDVLDAIKTLKDELNDQLADNHKEALQKIHEVDTYMRNVLEPNQKTLYNKLLELGDQEIEQPEPTAEA